MSQGSLLKSRPECLDSVSTEVELRPTDSIRSPGALLPLRPQGTATSTLCSTQQVLKTVLVDKVGSFPWELEGEGAGIF